MSDRHTNPGPNTCDSSLRLVTYNIHKGIGGLDRRYRIERIVEVLQGCHGDFIFLQEVDEGVPRSRHERQVDVLGDALGFAHRSFFPNVKLKRGHYGNALLSRFPIDHAENIDLTISVKKRRSALHARLSVNINDQAVRLWLFNTHLGLAEFERRMQLRRILGFQHQHRMSGHIASVIAGDFNDVWGRLGKTVMEPEGYQGSGKQILTFPAARPLRPLDRVFVRGPVEITHSYRSRQKLARQASDHLPLVADLRFQNVSGVA